MNGLTRKSQRERVLKYLKEYGVITPKIGTDYMGIHRLASIINRLRTAHYIQSDVKRVKLPTGERTVRTKYIYHGAIGETI